MGLVKINYPEDYIDKIICGDFKEIIKGIPDKSINLVITDPPYIREFLYTYEYLADECPRVMFRGSSLLTIVGHFAIPEVLKMFEGKMKYRWICCMNQFSGNHSRLSMGIEVHWKPILWFVNEVFDTVGQRTRGFVSDGVVIPSKNEAMGKKLHKWQQPEAWCEYYIERLTNPGDIVLIPFSGSGTECVVAKKLGRHFIGIDIDEEACSIANRRLNDISLQLFD